MACCGVLFAAHQRKHQVLVFLTRKQSLLSISTPIELLEPQFSGTIEILNQGLEYLFSWLRTLTVHNSLFYWYFKFLKYWISISKCTARRIERVYFGVLHNSGSCSQPDAAPRRLWLVIYSFLFHKSWPRQTALTYNALRVQTQVNTRLKFNWIFIAFITHLIVLIKKWQIRSKSTGTYFFLSPIQINNYL